MFDRPAADAGAVGLEVEAAVEFAGRSTVGGGRLGEQCGDIGGPVWLVIAAGQTGRPSVSATLSAGEQVVGAQLVVTADTDAQFERDGFG